jgi:hypothetical protein
VVSQRDCGIGIVGLGLNISKESIRLGIENGKVVFSF